MVVGKAFDSLAFRFNASFFFLGFLNNCEYVVLLSAALDLVGRDVPKGVILFANIAPALVVKLGWPYLVHGKVRYGRRTIWCSFLTFFGIVIVSTSPSLSMRVIGIGLASFSSGLGEITFLQLSTTYKSSRLGGDAVSWFSSGTGASGLVGSFLWWVLRGLGVKLGLGLTAFIPPFMSIIYFLYLPRPTMFNVPVSTTEYDAISSDDPDEIGDSSRHSYERPILHARDSFETNTPNFDSSSNGKNNDNDLDIAPSTTRPRSTRSMDRLRLSPAPRISLTFREKLTLAKPLLLPYVIPLFAVYFAEYSVNQGVSPTLLYPVPDPKEHPFLSLFIKQLSDYYPLWQMIYQTFVFFSRSSIAIFRLPPLPKSLIPLPSIVQVGILGLTTLEATQDWVSIFFGSYAMIGTALLVCVEGYCGGLSYVSAFYHLGQEEAESDDHHRTHMDLEFERLPPEMRVARREFKIACVGFADTFGILAASIFAMWMEPRLCGIQVSNGKDLCKIV